MVRKSVPDRVGVYAAISPENDVLYVGSSVRLKTRIVSHWINQDDGNGVQWRLGGHSEWYCSTPFAPAGSSVLVWLNPHHKQMEKVLIRKYLPKHNVQTYRKEILETDYNLPIVSVLNGGNGGKTAMMAFVVAEDESNYRIIKIFGQRPGVCETVPKWLCKKL